MTSKTCLFLILAIFVVVGMLAAGCTQQQAPSAKPPASTQTPSSQIANPASANCGNVGGTLEIKKDSTGGEYGMCNFPNGTTYEEWALYRGEGCKAGTSTTPAK